MIQGEVYNFIVEDLIVDSRGNHYYKLRNFADEEDTKSYRVRVMDYQVEWRFRPSHVRCFVNEVDENGYPKLSQLRVDLLEDLYPVLPQKITMRVEAKEVDDKTNASYLRLKDSASLQHRFYCSKEAWLKYKVGDDIEVYAEKIKAKSNSAYLDLSEFAPYDADKQVSHSTQETHKRAKEQPAIDETEKKYFLPEEFYEGNTSEWKSSIVYPAGKISPDMDTQLSVIARTVCGFLNRDGGKILIGVTDNRRIVGIEQEFVLLKSESLNKKYPDNRDGYELALRDALREKLGNYTVSRYVDITFEERDAGLIICVISVKPSPMPNFFAGSALYIRSGNMTTRLKGDEIVRFILDRMKVQASNEVQMMLQDAEKNDECSIEDDEQSELTASYDFCQEETVDEERNSAEELLPDLPKTKTRKEKHAHIAHVMIFHQNGSVSVEDNYLPQNEDIIWQQEIPRRVLKDASCYLMQCYASGRINKTPITNIRFARTKKGWNTNDQLVNVFLAYDDEKVAIYTRKDKNWYVKMHSVGDFTPHCGNLSLRGNLSSINENDGCRIYHVSSQNPDIGNLFLKSHYKTAHLGFQLDGEHNYDRLTMKMLKEICTGASM